MRSGRRSNFTLAAFSASCLPYAALGLPVYVTLPEFYADQIGVSQAFVALIFLAVRLADVVVDPFLGTIIDRTNTRFGRYRFWMAMSVPVLIVAVFMLFMVKPGAPPSHLAAWLVVMYAGFSIGALSQTAWASVLSPEYDQRSRIYAWWQAANIVGVLVVLAIPVVVQQAGWGGYVDAVRYQGWFIMAALPATFAITFAVVPEPRSAMPPPHGGLREILALFNVPGLKVLLGSDLMLGAARGTVGVLFYYFFEQARGFERSETTILLPIYFIAGLVGAPLWSWLATRIGKHRALAGASIFFAVSLVIAAMLPAKGDFMLTAVAIFVTGLAFGAGDLLLRAMMADQSDQIRLTAGADRTGLLFSILNGTSKLGYAFSVGTFALLDWGGFVTQAEGKDAAKLGVTLVNSAATIQWLEVLFIGLPVVCLLASSFLLWGYPLGPKRHAEIRAALDARATEG